MVVVSVFPSMSLNFMLGCSEVAWKQFDSLGSCFEGLLVGPEQCSG